MYKSSDKRYTASMKNAEASVRMEGCQVTPQMREQCQRALHRRGDHGGAAAARGAGQLGMAN